MANKKYKRLKSQTRLSGRFETGGISKVAVASPASSLGVSGSDTYFKAPATTTVSWEVQNGVGYIPSHSSGVIGNSTRLARSTDGFEFALLSGGGGGRHGGGGGGGFLGNGPTTPSPLRNSTVLTGPQFAASFPGANIIKRISENATGVVGVSTSYAETLTVGSGGASGAQGADTSFFGQTAAGGGRGGPPSSPGPGSPGGSGGGGGRGPSSGGTGSQGGNGYQGHDPRPGGWTGGAGGGTGGNGSDPIGGAGLTLSLPTPESVGGGGGGGGGAPGSPYCQGNQRPDGYCYGSYVPGSAAPTCDGNQPFGGGAANSNATLLGGGGGGHPLSAPNTSNGSDGAAWFKIATKLL